MVPWSAFVRSVPPVDDPPRRTWAEWRDADMSSVELVRTGHRRRPWVARIKNHRGAVESRRFGDERDACNWLLARRAVFSRHAPPPPRSDPPSMEWQNWL
jgi:hypothetical protein